MKARSRDGAEDPIRQAELAKMLEARSIAIVGASATPGSVGATTLLELLASGYTGRVFPVNPRYGELEGLRCLPSLEDLPAPVDLAVIAVSNSRLEEQLTVASGIGIGSAVIFASAFEEPRVDVPPLTERLATIAKRGRLAICGANCMGFVNSSHKLRACGYVLPRDLGPGPVSLISHSGSTFSALLHNDRGFRFNFAVSPGQELTTTATDYLDYCVSLEETRVVAMVLEQIRDPTAFARAAERAQSRDIAVVVLKVGREPRSAEMVRAHSGALAGPDGAYEALFDASGIHRVFTLDELADTVEIFIRSRRAAKGGLAAVTDSGGERAMLMDLAQDIALAQPAPATLARIAAVLDPGLEAVNPVDAWGTGADADHVFSEALQALHDDEDSGAVIFAVDLTGLSWERYVSVALSVAASTSKPFAILTNYRGGMNRAAVSELRDRGIPVLEGTATGLTALRHLFAHRDFADRPALGPPAKSSPEQRARWITRLEEGPVLTEVEALSLVADWGIPVARALPAHDWESALRAATEIGWPIALKTAAPDISHKTDAGGVETGLDGPDVLERAYRSISGRLGPSVTVQAMVPAGVEIALGVLHDESFGPLVVVGAGGILVEVLQDRRVGLPPLDNWRAHRLLGGLRMRPLLDGVRGQAPIDVDALASAIVSLSTLACDLSGHLAALDVNPLITTSAGCIAVDAVAFPLRGTRCGPLSL